MPNHRRNGKKPRREFVKQGAGTVLRIDIMRKYQTLECRARHRGSLELPGDRRHVCGVLLS
jgi:hypothetical protein